MKCLAKQLPLKLDAVSGVGCAQAIINGLLTGKETCCGESAGCSKPPNCSPKPKEK